MPSQRSNSNRLIPLLLVTICLAGITLPAVSAYVHNRHTLTTAVDTLSHDANNMTPGPVASRLLLQSPALDNVYKDFVVTSKPLSLRKYKNGLKTKKTKKDSKIYYIPIPPLPYRYIPGVGYDYQPMKIKPILQEPPAPKLPIYVPHQPKPSSQVSGNYGGQTHQFNSIDRLATAETKLLRMQHSDYYFNGRPFRLQVAHADRHQRLTPFNLKSKFYFNKNIIY